MGKKGAKAEMPTPEQLLKLYYLSDDVLYPTAEDFIQRFVKRDDGATLPASQVMGLLNIANASSYAELERFINHQRERNWTASKSYIKTFYGELEKVFATLRKRARDEFELLEYEPGHKQAKQETDDIMIWLARDFIQHLIAENGLLALEKAKERAKRR
jgi:hypothetical protein